MERFADPELAADWRLIVDCYAVQHDKYVLSGRSLAAHLTGVGIAIEHGGDESLLRAMQQWLSRTRELDKPAVPALCGDVTIHDVLAAPPRERHATLRRWAESAWGCVEGASAARPDLDRESAERLVGPHRGNR